MYAVSRNTEDPALTKMTPIMPTAIDSNDEVVHKGPTAVGPESDQVQSTPKITVGVELINSKHIAFLILSV